ncbi:MAG: bifunctional phosphopantothenoylcysteine decarboxylase/phosphopantothenate--cysteine ligase CoaBC [Deltaproteobacteria bacterium]|nr:MAG: bifunctional phosphopantothenoylcysteine decarboxylase/phosphopantothenate--cysteine ligase CoaBC [Deltaproteobacteria bacterium]RLB78901.1 MAG: bifunctional phosphopantothenoylcysteine decarboxylase/phosphopantothenate--cysteine ligase CoaBC [Deltaproteobacteria bacterium]
MIENKQIVVGVTGGIAAYKAAELARLLVLEGANVHVAMTEHAVRFIGPLTFEAITGTKVITHMFSDDDVVMDHISWGQESDLLVIAPATANFLAKMAHGIADDFLCTMVVAATAPILVCPAMNNKMYESPSVQENLRILTKRGVHIMEPAEGALACKASGRGRLPEPTDILDEIKGILTQKDLDRLKVLVTAGPTVEPLDPVRFISNRSSGKMGYAIARTARHRGGEVTLVSGPTSLRRPRGVEVVAVKTAEEMRKEVLARAASHDVVIMCAAVADYRPKKSQTHKIKKQDAGLQLELEKSPDILKELGERRGEMPRILVGFAAETQDLIDNAKEKLEKKNLDMIVINDVSRSDAGFEVDTNQVKILYRDGAVEELPLLSKDEVAHHILDRVRDILAG